MTLLWQDTFDQPLENNWTRETGGRWGNGAEDQHYTDRSSNASYDSDGNLVITARQERYTGSDGVTNEFTSARLVTRGKFSMVKGYYEVDAKIGLTNGAFPAIWTLGEGTSWPNGGEIDILEAVDRSLVCRLNIHASGWQYGWGSPKSRHAIPDMATAFHTYGAYFDNTKIEFYIDRQLVLTVLRGGRNDSAWPFGRVPQYLLLNYAIGHNSVNQENPLDGTWPQTMTVRRAAAFDTVPTRYAISAGLQELILDKMHQQIGRAATVLGPEYVGRLREKQMNGLADALERNVAQAIRSNAQHVLDVLEEVDII